AANAAAFAVGLAQELIAERLQTGMPTQGAAVGKSAVRGGRGADATMLSERGSDDVGGGAKVRTVAFHNHGAGQIGFQAGQVSGGTFRIGFGPEPTVPVDLSADLAALRNLLGQQRSAG